MCVTRGHDTMTWSAEAGGGEDEKEKVKDICIQLEYESSVII